MMDKKNDGNYPKVIVGAFIFNEKNELFLMKSSQWHNKYSCPGGKIEAGESAKDALKREIKEETNLDIYDTELVNVVDGLNLEESYAKEDNHLVFLDYKARAKDCDDIILNKEATKYRWLSIDEWKKNKKKLAVYIFESLEKIEKIGENKNFEERYKRALADYQNLLKRTTNEKQEFIKYANEQILLEIIPVYDNLKISLKHAKNEESSDWFKGVKYVVKQFKDVLEGVGIEEIKTEGKNFDHNIMEAIEGRGEKVKKEIRPGYKLNGKVIIPARVILD